MTWNPACLVMIIIEKWKFLQAYGTSKYECILERALVVAYVSSFADKDGKVWQGGGGRNPLPEALHLIVTTPEIEAFWPKSPMKKKQQKQSASISLATSNSTNQRSAENSRTIIKKREVSSSVYFLCFNQKN
ncbi:unnamed protein product [Ilex paraguariensis]|uniref:Uncharacterized protein n=1 Tax=Ilex paraguariensis TaxID=185542 RepID=A0ABC8QY60_9AQUA